MVFRDPPTCPFCGKVIANAIYNTNPNFIGDSFSRWEYENHEDCPGLKKTVRDKRINELLNKNKEGDYS